MTGSSMNTENTGETIDIIQELFTFIYSIPYYIFGGYVWKGGSKCLKTQTEPTLAFDIQTVDLMDIINLYSCGWRPGEVVQVTALNPSGKTIASFNIQAKEKGSQNNSPGHISLVYQPYIDDPTGNYTFTLKANSGTVAATVLVSRPGGAHLYHLAGSPWEPEVGIFRGKRNSLLLWGFTPGERARLIIYLYGGPEMKKLYYSLFGFQDYVIPEEGRMQVDLNLDAVGDQQRILVMAYGSRSGSVLLQDYISPAGEKSLGTIQDLYCPGTMPSRIDPTRLYVRAAYVDGTNLRIREQPGFSSPVLKSVPEGTILKRRGTNRFRCVDNTFWMWVYLPGSDTDAGWVAETYNSMYVVESVPKP